ncbi:DUF982 domain-containing protein [Sinorhizobium medicae]|uniref:DUF982 domain-containing protein n=1 Tax=Sinorhizobium medicae TaxID=110321 RepID=A0A6G1WV28_9HYPH|nr:DUF982 domain-containing protein [Sinorhizobium medicae]MQW73599.1 DUF982 domain-containing protein [Sinorhizobium medicae]MQX87731.1 DUF982 domain-containing protein [Sinorhizobium medicae]
MKEALWHPPLWISLQNGMPRLFRGPYDALDFLEHEWPSHGKWYHRAIRDCRAALSGIVAAEIARASFAAACAEASLALCDADAADISKPSANVAFKRQH